MTFTELSSPSIPSIKTWQAQWANRANLPTMYELPSEDPEEPGLPDEFHDYQPALLSETFKLQDYNGENSFCAADLNLYYDAENKWYKRPDWFGVLGKPAACESDELRMSYVVWQEGISPFVVVELISPGTENEDFGRTTNAAGKPPTKWTVYERILQIPYYVIYDRYTDTLSGFRLVNNRYQPMAISEDRQIWLPEANAGLGIWQGKHSRFTRKWLRWYSADGWILTDKEEGERQIIERERQIAESERQIAVQQAQLLTEQAEKEQAQREADKMRQRNAQLQAKLKTLGLELDEIDLNDIS